MALKNWAENGWLKEHKTSMQEISQLLEIVERDLKDSKNQDLSSDWKFGIAYNAALKLCTVLLYCEGYKPERSAAHYRTIQALAIIVGEEKNDDATYLNSCRAKRNMVEYDSAGGTTYTEAEELIEFVQNLKDEIINWLKNKHPEYYRL